MRVGAKSRVFLMALALAVVFCLVADEVFAQGNAASLDNELSMKKGLDTLDGGKKLDENKKPTKLQKILGIGSVFVAIAVVKWL